MHALPHGGYPCGQSPLSIFTDGFLQFNDGLTLQMMLAIYKVYKCTWTNVAPPVRIESGTCYIREVVLVLQSNPRPGVDQDNIFNDCKLRVAMHLGTRAYTEQARLPAISRHLHNGPNPPGSLSRQQLAVSASHSQLPGISSRRQLPASSSPHSYPTIDGA